MPGPYRISGVTLYTNVVAEKVAAWFRVLGDPTRLRLIQSLADGEERTVGDLARAVQTTVPNASKHLLLLAQAGLLRRARSGSSVWYSLGNPATLELMDEARAALGQAAEAARRELDQQPVRGAL